jgi:hypothetical protein
MSKAKHLVLNWSASGALGPILHSHSKAKPLKIYLIGNIKLNA